MVKVQFEVQSLKKHIKGTRNANVDSSSIHLGSPCPLAPEPYGNLQANILLPFTCSAFLSSLLPRNRRVVFCLRLSMFWSMYPSLRFLPLSPQRNCVSENTLIISYQVAFLVFLPSGVSFLLSTI